MNICHNVRLQTANYFLFGALKVCGGVQDIGCNVYTIQPEAAGAPAQTHPRGAVVREVKVPQSTDSHLHVSALVCANYSLTNRLSG